MFLHFVRWRHFFLVMVFSAIGVGCATESPKRTDDLATLKDKVWALQKQTAELGIELSETGNDVALLSERLNSLTKAMGKVPDKQAGTTVVPHAVDKRAEPAVVGDAVEKGASGGAPEPAEKAPGPVENAERQGKPAVNVKEAIKQDEKKDEPANNEAKEGATSGQGSSPVPVDVGVKFRSLDGDAMYRQAMVLFNSGEYARSGDAFRYFAHLLL